MNPTNNSMRGELFFIWQNERWLPQSRPCASIGTWLEGDIRASRDNIDLILAKIEGIEDEANGSNAYYVGTGNIFDMYANAEFFYLADLSGDDPRVLLRLDQAKKVLVCFQAIIDERAGPPLDAISFDYVALNEDAHEMAKRAGLFDIK